MSTGAGAAGAAGAGDAGGAGSGASGAGTGAGTGDSGTTGSGAGATGTGAAGAANPPVSTWTEGFDDDLSSYVKTKGFTDSKTVVESYRNLEKLRGVPENRLLKLPEKDDAPEWGDVWDKLGRPKEAKEYKFDLPEGADPKFADWAKGNFHKNNVPRKAAEGFVKEWNAYATKMANDQKVEAQAKATQASEQLTKEWGAAFNEKNVLADRALALLGDDKDTQQQACAALATSMGYVKAMNLLAKLGQKVGEDDFVGGSRNTFTTLSPGEAAARIKDLMKDTDFSRRYMEGDTNAKAEMDKLHRLKMGIGA